MGETFAELGFLTLGQRSHQIHQLCVFCLKFECAQGFEHNSIFQIYLDISSTVELIQLN